MTVTARRHIATTGSEPAFDRPAVEDRVEPAASGRGFDCRACGACCAYSPDWPRFSTEDDAELDRIPARHVAADGSGMRCTGAHCSALAGAVGITTACAIYAIRPHVCRACLPGSEECLMARRAWGLTVPQRG